jgi:predicted PurR-regulated permease PerM
MSEQQETTPSNNSRAWEQGAVITAVATSLILFIAFMQRYVRSLVTRPTPNPPPPETAPLPLQRELLPPTISEHDYNPDYDYHIESPPWGRYTKIITAVILLIIAVITAQRFQSLIAQLVIATILAYILNPIINFIDRRTKIQRNTILIITYLTLAVAAALVFTFAGIEALDQINRIIREQLPEFITNVTEWVQDITARIPTVTIGTFELKPSNTWETLQQQLLGMAESFGTRAPGLLTQIVGRAASLVGNLFFVFVLSIYIAIEIPKLSGYVGDFAQTPGYRQDAERLMREFSRIWSAYLRGQVILGLTIGLIVWIGLGILGVDNSLGLGLLSGLLEFIPIIGPVVGALAAMIVAFFQPDHCQGIFQIIEACNLVGWQFMLIVLGLMFVIQQLENNILVPRIVGEALDLHPLIVMVSVFMGASLAGILGAILAAPVAATLKLIGIYTWRKMFDDYPFQTLEVNVSVTVPVPQTLSERVRYLWGRLRPSAQIVEK